MDDEALSPLHVRHYLWMQGELTYKLDPLQNQIHTTVLTHYDVAKQICVLSSRQIGKSYWALVFALIYLFKNPGSIVRLLAPTFKKAYEVIEDNLYPILLDCPQGLINSEKSRMRWTFANGSSLRIGALERQYVDSNRSGNAKLVIYEECGFVKSDDFDYARRSVIGPQLLRSNGHEIFVSSPSEDPEHSLHNIVMPSCEQMGTLFRFTVYDSPSLTPMQIEQAAERSGGYDSDDFKREYLAMVVRSSTLMVVPKIDTHITYGNWEYLPAHQHRLCITGDWGGVRDKTVCYLHWLEPNTDIYYFLEELVFPPNTVTTTIADALKAWVKTYSVKNIFLDVHGQTRVDLDQMFGLQVQLPPKNDWLSGVNTMAAKFALNKVRIDHKCQFLRKSIQGGMFNKTRTDWERTEELGHMDGCAAAMYSFRTAHLAPMDNFGKKQHERVIQMEKFSEPYKSFGRFRS